MACQDTAPEAPPTSEDTKPPLQRSRSERSLPIYRPRQLTKQLSSSSSARPLRRLSTVSSARSAHRRYEDALKTEQFDRMMDRFQLRRVPLPRSHSNNSTTSIREAPFSARTQHESAQFLSHRDSTIMEPSQETPSSIPALGWMGFVRVGWRLISEPLQPAGYASQLRLLAAAGILVVQSTYGPFVVVYAHTHPGVVGPWSQFDLVADAVFLVLIPWICNTATHTTHGDLATSRRAIFSLYRRRGLLLDVLAALPLERLWVPTSWYYAWSVVLQLTIRVLAVRHQFRHFQVGRTDQSANQHSWLDGLLYSRFAHLVRIGRLVVLVLLMSHYMACVWTFLVIQGDDSPYARSPLATHIHSIYEVLQLLQGQGVTTTSAVQDAFGSVAVLLGSIALAVVFGHVAVLVSNFSANQTSYQRKMERVFAVMGKLQLPNPIRERVHQYYEYLHAEYESLDGEIVKFAKDLSHTLELEVVLFKYMDVVMHVPHWRECSPDFQKQLVLNLSVRVYLPDDYIMRRGEVGTECYIINRGVCHQHEYPGGNDEAATPPVLLKYPKRSSMFGRGSTRLSGLRYALPNDESGRPADEGSSHSISLLRGQAIGEKALITNYRRSSDVRAFTYVEMSVLEREPFQRILTRYPSDRRRVLANIVRQCVQQRALQGVECEMMTAVHRMAPAVSFDHGVSLVVEAMCRPVSDPSIVFGANEHFERELKRVVGSRKVAGASTPHNVEAAVVQQVETLQIQLNRIDGMLQSLAGFQTPRLLKQTSMVPTHVYESSTPGYKEPQRGSSTANNAPRRALTDPFARLHRRASDMYMLRSTQTPYTDKSFNAQRMGGLVRFEWSRPPPR